MLPAPKSLTHYWIFFLTPNLTFLLTYLLSNMLWHIFGHNCTGAFCGRAPAGNAAVKARKRRRRVGWHKIQLTVRSSSTCMERLKNLTLRSSSTWMMRLKMGWRFQTQYARKRQPFAWKAQAFHAHSSDLHRRDAASIFAAAHIATKTWTISSSTWCPKAPGKVASSYWERSGWSWTLWIPMGGYGPLTIVDFTVCKSTTSTFRISAEGHLHCAEPKA